jgi:hypothetical protein
LSEVNEIKGLIMFGGLILIVVAASLAAYLISGHMGIEDRFNSAVGISTMPEEEGGSGILGFNIEGNPAAYVIISSALIVICVFLYTRFKI